MYRRISSRKSFGTAVPSSNGLNAANNAAVSAAHLSSMYQTVLKMSSENKINAKNTWNLPLIDHMEKVIRGDLHDKKPSNENNSSSSSSPALLAPSVMNTKTNTPSTGKMNDTKPDTNKRQSRTGTVHEDTQPKKLLGDSDAALLNFQRASCTLDASIKIWSYRVDDVYNTSYRVLENLTRKNNGKDTDGNEDIHGMDEGTMNGDMNDPSLIATRTAQARTNASRSTGSTTTIEKNIQSITTKRIEADYDVDPLFHKLSSENGNNDGGASGMLLNRLAVYSGCNLAFDSTETLDIDNTPGSDYNFATLMGNDPHQPVNTLSVEETTTLHTDFTRNLTKTDVVTAEMVLSLLQAQVFTPSLETLYTNLYTFATAIGDTKTVNLLSGYKNKTTDHSTTNNTPIHLLQQLDGTHTTTTNTTKGKKSSTVSQENSTSAWSAVAILTERMENNNNDTVPAEPVTSSSSSSSTPNPTITLTSIPMDDLSTIDDVLANAVPVTVTNDKPDTSSSGNYMDDEISGGDNWVGGYDTMADNGDDDIQGSSSVPPRSSVGNSHVLGLAALAPASTGAMAEYTYVDLSVLSNAVATGTNSNQSMNHWKLRTAAIEAVNQLEKNKTTETSNDTTSTAVATNGTKTTKGTKSSKRKGVFSINFGPENKIPTDAFSKAKVPLTVGGNKGAKGGIVRDAEQMTSAAIEKCEKNTSNNAYLLPKIRQHIDPVTLRNTGLFALTDHILSLSFKPQIRINARTLTTVNPNTVTNGVVGDVFFAQDQSSSQHTGSNHGSDSDDNGSNDFYGNDDDGGYDDMPMITTTVPSTGPTENSSSSAAEMSASSSHTDGPVELVTAGRQVEKIRVRYETVAKRVDVAALKSDMLHLLCPETKPVSASTSTSSSLVPLKLRSISHKVVENDFRTKGRANEKNFTDTSGAALTETSNSTPTNVSPSSSSSVSSILSGGAQFTDAIKALAPEMSSQVTVPFYFITLLHLANEHGLALNGRNDLSDFEIGKLTP